MKMKSGADDVRQLLEDVSRMIRTRRRLAFSAARTPTVLRNLRRTRTVRMVDTLGRREIGENVEGGGEGLKKRKKREKRKRRKLPHIALSGTNRQGARTTTSGLQTQPPGW